MPLTEVSPVPDPAADEAALLAWDWRAELKRQERSLEWLARRSQRSVSSVNNYSTGRMVAPVAWLRLVADVLGRAA